MQLEEASYEDWDAEVRRRWSRANSNYSEIEKLQFEIRVRSSDSGWYHRIGYWMTGYKNAHNNQDWSKTTLHEFAMWCQGEANKRRAEIEPLRKKLRSLKGG